MSRLLNYPFGASSDAQGIDVTNNDLSIMIAVLQNEVKNLTAMMVDRAAQASRLETKLDMHIASTAALTIELNQKIDVLNTHRRLFVWTASTVGTIIMVVSAIAGWGVNTWINYAGSTNK